MIVDFHCHTHNSDGSLTTADLVASMDRNGVSVFSITDHDTIRAYDELPATRAQVVSGIEINTTHNGNDVHILGYGFDRASASPINATLAYNREARRTRVQTMIALLVAAGYPITPEMVAAESVHAEALGRPHVAKALVRSGMVRDIETCFKELLSRGGPGYLPSHHITPVAAIESIAKSGGVPVLAHPGRLRDSGIIDELAQAGLAGIEVFYPTHTSAQTSYYRGKAKEYGLVMTAGSDFHDSRWNGRTVGVEVEREDIAPFLDVVLAA